MSLIRRLCVAAPTLLVAVAIAGSAHAQDTPSKAEQLLKYRKSLYQVMAWNFGPLAAMSQGKIPYDATEFATRADRVAAITPMLSEAFQPETQGVANSKLKPEMWSNRVDFDSKLKDLVDRSQQLAAAAKTGDFEKSKAAWVNTANACKACHDKYRAK